MVSLEQAEDLAGGWCLWNAKLNQPDGAAQEDRPSRPTHDALGDRAEGDAKYGGQRVRRDPRCERRDSQRWRIGAG